MLIHDRSITEEDDLLTSKCRKSTDPLPWYQEYKESPVAIVEENEMPQWKTPEQLWDAVSSMGTNFVRYPAIGWGAHFYKESKYLPKYPGMRENEDFFGAVCEYFHAHGGKVMSYNHFGGVLYGSLVKIHPDWFARTPSGELMPWNNMHYLACLCSDGFCDAEVQAIDEYCSLYHPDAVYMDAPSFYHRWCNCEGCRKLYRETYSEELPDSPPEDGASEWGRIGSMRINRKYAIMNALHKVTQKHGIPLILNVRGHCRAGNGDPVLEIAAADGTNSGEGYRPKANFWSMATLWRMGEAFRKVQYGYCPTGTFFNMRSYSSDEGVVVGMSEAMFSMTPFLESATSYLFDKTGSDTLKTVCQNIEEHREMYYRTVPINDIAVVSDGKAINYLTSKECKNLYMDYQGCIEALTLENRHFECMYDRQISRERIKGYRAVYLPLTSFVPPKTREVLEEYVRSGGTVICGPDFSRRNADMQEIDFYEMSDFLGVDFTRKNDRSLIDIHQREYRESACVFPYAAIPEAYVRVEKDMPGMKASSTPVIPVSDTVVRLDDDPYLEYTIANPHSDTEVLASLYLPAGGTRGEPLEFPDGTPPAVTRHKFGNGYVYWLAIRPGLAFIKNPRFDIPHLIRAICDMPGEGPAVQFDTAGAVLCFLVENGKGTAWLHLSSYTGAMLERSIAPERIVPLSHIPFKIRCSALPFDVDEQLCIVTEYGEEKLPWHLESNYVCFTLPELKLYQSLRFFKK